MLSARTRLLSTLMKWLTLGIGIFLVGSALSLGGQESLEYLMSEYMPGIRPVEDLSSEKIWLLRLAGLFPLIFTALVFFQVFRIFSQFQGGDVFSISTVKAIRSAGAFMIALALTAVISSMAASVILTYDNPPGARQLSITFGSQGLILLTVGVVLRFVGQTMVEAIRMEEENRQFI